MSIALRQTVERAVEELEALSRDLRRPRPADWTPEDSDERTAKRLERLAARLAAALEGQADDS